MVDIYDLKYTPGGFLDSINDIVYFFTNKIGTSLKDVRLLCVNIDRALIIGYDLHEHFMQLILKFGPYLQHILFIT